MCWLVARTWANVYGTVLESVTESKTRKIVKINNLQFGFMAGMSMTEGCNFHSSSAAGKIPGKDESK